LNRQTFNVFQGCRDTDTDPSIITPDRYLSAYNVELSGEGKYNALTNVAGTSVIGDISALINPSTESIVGTYPTKYSIDGTIVDCLTVFTLGDKFRIFCYRLDTHGITEIFNEFSNYALADLPNITFSVINYPENGYDVLYFTDFRKEMRKLRCSITTPFTQPTAYQLSLGRKGALGTITLNSISATGGSLLTGSYQLAYRMLDPLSKSTTKWSTLANPVHIYSQNNGDDPVYAGVGLGTTRKIIWEIRPSEIELANYNYIQYAIVENVFTEPQTTADISDVRIVNAVGGVITFEYKANTSYGTIPLTDITVDLAAIDTVKTLTVSANRLFAGNIKYRSFPFDGGIPTPPPPVTVDGPSAWVNTPPVADWALGAVPFTSINTGGQSQFIVDNVATLSGYTYSFTITINVMNTGAYTPAVDIEVGLLDASYVLLSSQSQSYSGPGNKVITVTLSPSAVGSWLGVRCRNNTPFETKNVQLIAAQYNAPSAVSGPRITSGNFIVDVQSSVDAYSSDYVSSTKIGHFRNEVYRYGIVYSDENGNKSPVSPLDLGSLISDNQITAGVPDVKFPDRSVSTTYSLLDTGGNIKALGLHFNGISGHPTWAAGFEIVRMKRKKNIVFQTPIIPMYELNGVGSLGEYPARYGYLNAGTDDPSAQPQTAGSTYVPKNFAYPEIRGTERNTVRSGSGATGMVPGEIKMNRVGSYNYAMIFPSDSMYTTTNPYLFIGNETLDVVDYALLKCDANSFSTPPTVVPSPNLGNYVNTSVTLSMYATGDAQYFYNSAQGGKAIETTMKNMKISDYEFFNFGDASRSVSGVFVLDYEGMDTKNTQFGFKPSIQKSAVVKLQNSIPDLSNITGGVLFKDGTLNKLASGGFVFGPSGLVYASQIKNDYMFSDPGYTDQTSNVSAVPIANMLAGLSDDRYGELTSFGEYISTGAKYTFTANERALLRSGTDVSVNLDVWGGDCFISYHSFKVCDSTYSIVNQGKYYLQYYNASDVSLLWGRTYIMPGPDPNHSISLPVAVKNNGQFIQVLLESEYNGGVRDIDTIPLSNFTAIPRFVGNEEAQARSPLAYKYNQNLLILNQQKIYVPKQQYTFEQNDFQARVVWSDTKIYNSDQAGFDVFRVADLYDLEETRYGITKLARAGDAVYAIQERGIVYLPIDSSQMESTDGGTIAIRSGDVIGRPIIVDTIRGSQHMNSIVETGGLIYVPDAINKQIYVLAGQEVASIVENNETRFKTFLGGSIPEANLTGIYDPVKRQYWIINASTHEAELFNEPRRGWVSTFEFNPAWKSGTSVLGKLIFGSENTLHLMYSGIPGTMFGDTKEPRVTFVINPDEALSKTFDDIMISSTERMKSLDIIVKRELDLGNQIIPTISLDDLSIEGNFRVKTARDSAGARPRGIRAEATVRWKDTVMSALQSFWTKYRLSSRTPW
jgi:hypothetical protein